MKEKINIVWFKRDLRFTDHEPLYLAQQQNLPVLLIYFFEPSLMAYEDSDLRHWRFIYESLNEMQGKLKSITSRLYIFHNEVLPVFKELEKHYALQSIFSHQEVGNKLSYDRDIAVKNYCIHTGITWKESQLHGIIRNQKTTERWEQKWHQTMTSSPRLVDDTAYWTSVNLENEFYRQLKGAELPTVLTIPDKNFQPGGESFAWKYLDSFIKKRSVNYSQHISRPALSRKGCSRLSPYLTYGNISMRMVYFYIQQHYDKCYNKRDLVNFKSRLLWHCHFMQKFERDFRIEFENANHAYDQVIKPKNDFFIQAWQEGKTGVPLVDACMRCVVATGYLNFRMRAMVVSFFVFNLWQDWRELHFLARQFLDYEPGIHYPQLQMQSGVSGFNPIRIYNPIKNSQDHDPEGLFIKQWLPELVNIPPKLVHEPWKLSLIEQDLYACEIGKDYPLPIVDVEESRKHASEIMWQYRGKRKLSAVN